MHLNKRDSEARIEPVTRLPMSPLILAAAYRAYFRKTFAVQLQYRASLLIWLMGSILEPLIYLVVWSTVAGASGGSVGGYTAAGFAAYYIVMMVADHLTFTWVMWEYDYRMRMGELSTMLLRPMHPIHEDIADNITYKVLTLSVMVPAVGLLIWLFDPVFETELWAVLAFLPALFLSFLLRFFLGWSLAMVAFWTTRISAFNSSVFVVELFLSGRIAPLAVLPAGLRAVATALPFRWALAFPVELFLGRLTPRETLAGFGMQLLWLAISLVLVRLIWRAGVRQYAAFGS
jgi:ABC-2 type transport system permease protein